MTVPVPHERTNPVHTTCHHEHQDEAAVCTCSMHSSAADAPRSAGCAAATRAACCDSSAPLATSRDAARSITSDSSHGRQDDDPDLPFCVRFGTLDRQTDRQCARSRTTASSRAGRLALHGQATRDDLGRQSPSLDVSSGNVLPLLNTLCKVALMKLGQGRVTARLAVKCSPAERERVDGPPQDAQHLAQDDQVQRRRLASGCHSLLAPCGLQCGDGSWRRSCCGA